jgi:hypothetical protein
MPDLFDSPADVRNAFEHQRFRLRTAAGERVTRSFREIVTETDPDAAYALDYPQAFYNAAALNLLAFLAQWAFEPKRAAELADRVERPLAETEFEAAVGPLRQRFALTGDGPRFMQAPGPGDPKKAKPIEEAVLITHAGDKSFLHRADPEWAITPDQAALFLFARNTFYEGTGGRGYQKGTNGDTPIRSLVTVAADGDAVQLRKSLWLNVLSREWQETKAQGEYPEPGEGYDGLFWVDPPDDDVPTGGISLRAGLGWMTANHWLWIEPLDDDAVCVVTGEPLAAGTPAARTLSKWTTGIAYGTKGDLDAGTRADRLFRHPNVPLAKVYDRKTGDPTGRRPFLVQRTRGLVDAVGGSFFGASNASSRFEPAPAVLQLVEEELDDVVRGLGLQLRLSVFGFHMLSNQKNVHGGVEADTFRYRPLVGATEAETVAVNEAAAECLHAAGAFAERAARDLATAVQRAAGLGVRATEDPASGRINVETKFASTPSVEDPFGDDALAAFWADVQSALVGYAHRVAQAARQDGVASHAALVAARHDLQHEWEDEVVRLVWRHFEPVYNHHLLNARTMPYAAAAHRMLGGALKKHRTVDPAAVS